MFKLAGIVSVKLTPVRLVALLLFKVIVTVLTPFMAMLVGEYALVPVSAGVTTRLLWAGEIFVTPGWAAVKELAGIVLLSVPEVVKLAWTVAVMVQVPTGVGGVALAGITPPVKVIDVAVLLTTPPHWDAVGVPEIVNPAGRLSVMPTPV
jgi:hypothetical protein